MPRRRARSLYDRVFLFVKEDVNKGVYAMEFMLLILGLLVLMIVVTKGKNNNKEGWMEDGMSNPVRHPAEFELREDYHRIELWF